MGLLNNLISWIHKLGRFLFRIKIFLKHLWNNLSQKERIFAMSALFFFIGASLFLGIRFWLSNTIEIPVQGGILREGVVGSPRYINPLLAPTNDADRDLSQLIFSGLVKYNGEGEIVSDLAKKYEVSEDGKVYEFFLRENVMWHDGEKFTAEDVMFTIGIIQDFQYQSPLRVNWQGVKAEKVDDYRVKFILTSSYVPFLENTTIGIIPKHIWQDTPPSDFMLAKANANPIGTGPYKLNYFKKSSLELEVYENYYGKSSSIKKVILKFFDNEGELIDAYNKKQIDALSINFPKNLELIKNMKGLNVYRIIIPRYFAVFFNQTRSKNLADKNIREAIAYATNKEEIVEKVLGEEGKITNSPIPEGIFGSTPDVKIYEFDPEKAKNILETASWRDSDGDGIRDKEREVLNFELITTDKIDFLVETARLLKEQWKAVGIDLDVKILGVGEIQRDYIRPRNYQILLFGEVLGQDPDPFSFWHSSQKRDPGLNLALYDNKKVDELLTSARQTYDENERKGKYEEFQKLVTEDLPAIFLYSPYYLYLVNKNVKGIEIKNIIDPSKRFSEIEEWYMRTKRIWK